MQRAPGGQRFGAVEHTDIVEPKEPAGKEVFAVGVLAVHPPGEIQQQLLKDAFQKVAVALARFAGNLIDPPRGPGVHRRAHIVERKFIRGDLAVGMHVPFAQKEEDLFLGEPAVDARERNHVERQVPRGEPGIFPLVGHRNDIATVEVCPFPVAALPAGLRRWRHARVPRQPVLNDIVIKLF